MNFALLWIDALLIALLWVALAAATMGRINRRWIRGLLLLPAVGLPLIPLAGFAFGTWFTRMTTVFEPNWFAYSVWLLIAYVLGALLILRMGRRREPGLRPASVAWAQMPLAFAWLMAVAVGYMTLMNMDMVIRARCAIESVEANSRYLAALPAVTSYSQNAAPLYQKAFAQLIADPPADVNNPPTGNHDDFDPKEPATIAFLGRHVQTIDLLRRGAAMPACRYDQDLGEPDIQSMLADLNQDRNAANVLNLHAREELANGHVASAMIDATSILRMARHIGQRPMLISGMVGIGIGAIGDKTLEQALPEVTKQQQLSPLKLDELTPFGPIIQQALRGEERFGLDLYAKMPPSQSVQVVAGQTKDPGLMSPGNDGPVGALYRVFFLNSDAYIRMMEKLQDLSIEPFYRSQPALAEICAQRGDLFTSIVLPSLRRNFESCARIEALDACAQAAVAMTRYRLDHNALPSHLSDLVPAYLEAVPTDPFTGNPIHLAIKGDQWIIYSFGPDARDHGGVEDKHGNGDVIFTLSTHSPPTRSGSN
jgi:hypothetical protein